MNSDAINDATSDSTLPEELLAARDRVADQRARARRCLARGHARRRLLPQIAVISVIFASFGLADRFVQAIAPSAAIAASPATKGGTTGVTVRELNAVARALAADQRVIAALAKAQTRLVQGASSDNGTAPTLSGSGSIPSLPSLGPIPSVAIPTISAPPTVATTGASVVVP